MDNYQPAGSELSPRQLAEHCFAVVRRLRQHGAELAGDLDLSFLQARALWRLERPLQTGELAEQLGLDRSNITSVIDRLEERGLVTRQAHLEDRRVKLVVLTDAGRVTRAILDEQMFATLTVFDALSDDERRELAGLLSKIAAAQGRVEAAPVAP